MPVPLMKKRNSVLLLCAFLICASAVPAERRPTLTLQENYSNSSRYSRRPFTFKYQCLESLKFVDSGGIDGNVELDYIIAENKTVYGRERGYGLTLPDGINGVDITFRLSFRRSQIDPPLFAIEATESSPARAPAGRMIESTEEKLANRPQFRLACSALMAVLGSSVDMRKILGWAAERSDGLRVLELAKFSPSTDRENAYLLVARHEFATLAPLGKNAIDPLRRYLSQFATCYANEPLRSLRETKTTNEAELIVIAQAVEALARASDVDERPTIETSAGPELSICSNANFLSRLLIEADIAGVNTVALSVISAIAAIGGRSELAALEKVSGTKSNLNADVQSAAKDAQRSIEARLNRIDKGTRPAP